MTFLIELVGGPIDGGIVAVPYGTMWWEAPLLTAQLKSWLFQDELPGPIPRTGRYCPRPWDPEPIRIPRRYFWEEIDRMPIGMADCQ